MALYEKAAWKGRSAMEIKPWGTETKWSALRNVNGKMLNIREGHRTSLKYNKRKQMVLRCSRKQEQMKQFFALRA